MAHDPKAAHCSAMRKSTLQLRSLPWIGVAYIVAPALGIAVWLALPMLWDPNAPGDWQTLGMLLMVLAPMCLLVECLVVTPLLVAFAKWQWAWLNGWSAAALGFFVSG